jgi:hypothetical protein
LSNGTLTAGKIMPKHTLIATALAVALTALAPAMPMNAHAQRGEADLMERLRPDIASDTYAQSDRQSGLKQALKLSAEQEKLWVPVEEALRNLQEQRYAIQSGLTEAEPTDQMERLRRRAEVTTQRADALKKLADAVLPLWVTLSEEQKRELAQSLSLPPSRTELERRMSRREDRDDDMRYRDPRQSSRYKDEDRSYQNRRDEDRWGWRDRRDRMMSGRDEADEDDRDVRGDRFDRYRRSHDDFPPRAMRERDRYDFNRRSDRDHCRCDRLRD